MTRELNSVKAVIFDMDGLLIASEKIVYQLNQELVASYGKVFDLDDYVRNYSGKTAVVNMIHLIEQFQLPFNAAEGLERMRKLEHKYLEQGIELHKGARELLQYLKEKHCKMILATSSDKERAVKILSKNRVLQYFDAMAFGPEVKRGKPYPDIFLKACEKAGEMPEHCLVLEDSEAGIKAAHEAGVPVICVPDLKRPAREFAEMTICVVESLSDVMEYLKTQY